jgi:molybdopterin-containing oxidoreductase family iron-sulfur binding subunit
MMDQPTRQHTAQAALPTTGSGLASSEAEQAPVELSRRQLIARLMATGAGALAAAMSAGGVVELLGGAEAAAAAQPAGGQAPKGRRYRYGMVIDTRRCVGCRACVVACKAENKTPPGVNYTVVVEDDQGSPDGKPLFLTKPCFQCENPPCVPVCPVSATFKRERDGIVVVDYDRCIGCRYCITACPYGARTFDFGENYPALQDGGPIAAVPSPEYGQYRVREHEASPVGNVRKCTFCMHLQDQEGRYDKAAGRWPACAKTCTGHAIHFGDFMDPNSEVSRLLRERHAIRLKEELGTEPNVYYLL